MRHNTVQMPATDGLAALLSAARTGSFSAAAEELDLSHGAVSRRIQALEAWLGASLFERNGRGVTLTAVGAQFARRVERSMSAIAEVAKDIRAARETDRIRLSVLPSFARLWLMPRIAMLEGSPRDLVIQLVPEHRLAEIGQREVDLAIRSGYGDWPGLEARRLIGETIHPVAAPVVAARIRRPEDCMDQLLIHDSDSTDWRRWCEAKNIRYAPRAGTRRYDDYDLVLAAAKAGMGVALARLPLAEQELSEGGLIAIPGDPVPIGRAHWVVTRQSEARGSVQRLIQRLCSVPEGAQASIHEPR